MRFPLSWLKDYLKTDLNYNQICDKLTKNGLEVEEIFHQSAGLEYFTVAKILSTTKVENSNKLNICQVEVKTVDGYEILQIVCGASNARAGIKVAYAPIGSLIPANLFKIKKAKIAGIESNGMLCSESELLIGEEEGKIIEIDEKFPVGTKIYEVYNLNEKIITINVTPNRGDCLGIFGIARDLAAANAGELILPKYEAQKVSSESEFKIKNQVPNLCSAYAFREIRNLDNNIETPKWLKDRLENCNIRSISLLVDIANYSMLVFNKPMHVYDADKISKDIFIDLARDETYTAIDGKLYSLTNQDIVIKDDKKVIALAGIMGSNDSACDENTRNVLVECANFEKINILKSAKYHKINSDAKYRFERGVDSNNEEVIEYFCSLLNKIQQDAKFSDIKKFDQKIITKIIDLNIEKIKKLTGVEPNLDEIISIFNKLELKLVANNDNKISVSVPNFRGDIEIEEDLIEEFLRIYGYDKIKTSNLKVDAGKYELSINDKIRENLANIGYFENINWSFIDSNLAKLFNEEKKELYLTNPITSDLDYMRENLLIGLLNSTKLNLSKKNNSFSIFEIGNIFNFNEKYSQTPIVTGLRVGNNKEDSHYQDSRNFDIFDVKQDLTELLNIFSIKVDNLKYDIDNIPPYCHPYRSSYLCLGKINIGLFGEIHPLILKKLDIEQRVNFFEIYLSNIPQKLYKRNSKSNIQAFEYSLLHRISRDICFVVDKEIHSADIFKTILGLNNKFIENIKIIDIYNKIEIDGKKSITFRLLINPRNENLNSNEIENIVLEVIKVVETKFNAQLRLS